MKLMDEVFQNYNSALVPSQISYSPKNVNAIAEIPTKYPADMWTDFTGS